MIVIMFLTKNVKLFDIADFAWFISLLNRLMSYPVLYISKKLKSFLMNIVYIYLRRSMLIFYWNIFRPICLKNVVTAIMTVIMAN